MGKGFSFNFSRKGTTKPTDNRTNELSKEKDGFDSSIYTQDPISIIQAKEGIGAKDNVINNKTNLSINSENPESSASLSLSSPYSQGNQGHDYGLNSSENQ